MCAGKSHRGALLQENQGQGKGNREKRIDDDSPHIDEEVPEIGIASQSSDNGGQTAEADRGGQEKVRQTKERLAEVGKMLITGIVLQIRVGHEGNNTVKDRARSEHSAAQIV